MSKDHVPSGFNRTCAYRSDLENSEMQGVRINTSGGSHNHNVYVHNKDGTHEHFWYDPAQQRSGYHGENFPTKNNHPQMENKEDNKMADINTHVTAQQYDETLRGMVNSFYEHAMNDSSMSNEEARQQTAQMAEAYLNAMDEFNAEANTSSGQMNTNVDQQTTITEGQTAVISDETVAAEDGQQSQESVDSNSINGGNDGIEGGNDGIDMDD